MTEAELRTMDMSNRIKWISSHIVHEFECVHIRDIPFYTKDRKSNIEFVTKAGTPIVLKWEKAEYRAYNAKGEWLKLGATSPKNLIEYIKDRY